MTGGPTLRGERVTLRPMTNADAPLLVRWARDPEFAWLQWGRRAGRFSGEDSAREWLDRFAERAGAVYAIEHDGRVIGQVNYRDLQPKAKSCEVGISIGEKALWGKHLGREALALFVRHLVVDRDTHRVSLHVLAYNDRAIASYKAVGFQVEGIERDAVMTDEHGYADDVGMAYLSGRPRPDFEPVPVTLEGEVVRLVPLRMEHAAALHAAGDEADIWRHVFPRPVGLAGFAAYIRSALDQAILGQQLPFAVLRRADDEIVGTTRYAHIDPPNRTIEIGYTFYGRGARRTKVNTECKLLLFRHAFETLRANRVWLQTGTSNERSQNAIARLGAVKEGELRNERILPDGRLRTSVIFSVTVEEWPAVRARLQAFLAR